MGQCVFAMRHELGDGDVRSAMAELLLCCCGATASGGNGNGTGELVDRRIGRAQVVAGHARASAAHGIAIRRPAMSVTHAALVV